MTLTQDEKRLIILYRDLPENDKGRVRERVTVLWSQKEAENFVNAELTSIKREERQERKNENRHCQNIKLF